MDGEWNEVKAKPKKKKAPQPEAEHKPAYGGKTAKGKLVAGPIKKNNAGGGGGDGWGQSAGYGYGNTDYSALNNQASAIADFDYHIDSDEEVKYETVSHQCAQAVSEARLKANMTQT